MDFEWYEVICFSGVSSCVRSCAGDVRVHCRGRDNVAEGSSATGWGETVTEGVIGTLSAAGSEEWIRAVLMQQPIGRYLSSSDCARPLEQNTRNPCCKLVKSAYIRTHCFRVHRALD